MKYIVTNSASMLRLEEFVKSLPSKFLEQFSHVTEGMSNYDNITFYHENYYLTSIEMINLIDPEINFNEDESITIKGKYLDKYLEFNFNKLSLKIKKIKFKDFTAK